MSTPQDKAKLAAGAKDIHKAEADRKAEKPDTGKRKPSWRDFYDVHEAAAFFHSFSDQDQLNELAADIDKRQVIFMPIHTASVLGKAKPFVIDGISRLDGAEKTGRQIINENGKWIGMLDGHVVDHPGKTDEEVWEIVISLNNKRRHYTDGQRAVMAAELAKRLAPKMSFPSVVGKLSKRGRRGEGRPSKAATAATKQAAKMTGVSEKSVERVQQIERDAPDKIASIKAGKLSPSKAASELKPTKPRKGPTKPKEKTFEDWVLHKFGLFMNSCWKQCRDKWPGQGGDVQLVLVDSLLALRDRDTDKLIQPVSVIYPDNVGTHKIADVLAGQVQIGKRRELKPVWSHVIYSTKGAH